MNIKMSELFGGEPFFGLKQKRRRIKRTKSSKQENNFLTLNQLNEMQEGTVKFFNDTKGFGFITPDDNSKDVFVHVTGLEDEIREGDRVTFEVQQGKKGPNAVHVRLDD